MKKIIAICAAAVLAASPLLCIPVTAIDTSYPAMEYTYAAELESDADCELTKITDGMEATNCEFKENDTLTIHCGGTIGGIYIKFDLKQTKWFASSGEAGLQFGTNGFLHEYADVSALDSDTVTLHFEEDTQICEMRLFSTGAPPENVQVWEPQYEKADLALFSSHADDETLFLMGLIPLCAASGKKLQVIYFCEHNDKPLRLHEQLNGLWASGSRHYPFIGRFPDLFSEDIDTARNLYAGRGYSEDDILACQVEMLRRFRPNVICCHDINGEYGHGTHCLNTATLMQAVEISGDPESYPDSAEKYGVWDVPKTYIHLLEDNPITLDFDQPLDYFGGKTAYEMSIEGYNCHYTQHWTWFTRWAKGDDEEPVTAAADIEEYSPCLYGLYRSTVGPDTGINDLFENIPPEEPAETAAPAPLETFLYTTTTTSTTTTSTTTTTTTTTTVTTTTTATTFTTTVEAIEAPEIRQDEDTEKTLWITGSSGAAVLLLLLLKRHIRKKRSLE